MKEVYYLNKYDNLQFSYSSLNIQRYFNISILLDKLNYLIIFVFIKKN